MLPATLSAYNACRGTPIGGASVAGRVSLGGSLITFALHSEVWARRQPPRERRVAGAPRAGRRRLQRRRVELHVCGSGGVAAQVVVQPRHVGDEACVRVRGEARLHRLQIQQPSLRLPSFPITHNLPRQRKKRRWGS